MLFRSEEDYEEGEGATDIPMAYLSNSGKITLLQLDGKIRAEELKEAMRIGQEACKKIHECQVKALKEAE